MNRLLRIGFVALAFPSVAFAQEMVGGWIADKSTGCRVWNPYPTAEESVKWDGECFKGFAQGSGMQRWYKKGVLVETATAVARHGMLNGHVMVVSPDFNFDGEFRDNVASGPGTLKLSNGQVYSGQWAKGCFNDGSRRFAYTVTKASCGIP
jgi:hypothetical protein